MGMSLFPYTSYTLPGWACLFQSLEMPYGDELLTSQTCVGHEVLRVKRFIVRLEMLVVSLSHFVVELPLLKKA